MTMIEKLRIHQKIEEANRKHEQEWRKNISQVADNGRREVIFKYYIFTYKDGAGGGKRYIRARSEEEALDVLNRFLERYHSTRKYQIELERVLRD